MAARRGVLGLLFLIRVPLVLAVFWAIAGLVSFSVTANSPVLDGFFAAVHILFFAAAGYLAVKGSFGLWGAALAGATVMFAEHVLVKGIAFLAEKEFMAAGGVLLSFVMFSWVAMLAGALGGEIARRRGRVHNAAI